MTEENQDTQESQIAALLESKFGNGLIYLKKAIGKNNSRALLKQAAQLGFVDTDGYLTRKGRSLLTRYHFNR